MKTMLRIAGKEFGTFFSSPAAYIFLGAFLGTTFFIFFWIESFFARNIADLQPLFKWMPLLLIFLCGAITMRMWAEERRTGTRELLMTSPVSSLILIGGKFLACLGLVALALLLSVPLAVTVSFIGPLDWGPVFGGYLASLFLASAYISIGIFVSSRSDNQLVALITTVLICTVFYFLGSSSFTAFFDNSTAEFLKLLGSGSRFESITRGVIDIRDLIYYLSICAIFLVLTGYSLEQQRWAGNKNKTAHRTWQLVTLLAVINLVVVNIWMAPVQKVRVDLTENKIYTLSDATRSYLSRLREPLLIRGYFSAQTHPLLAPLVPRLRDLLKEYEAAGNGRVRVEIVDPGEHPDLEQEAGEKYGIRPVPFRTASRYQTAVTNSYFDILVSYGSEFETLNFRDLIDIKTAGETEMSVDLKNPEYDISQAIKKVLYSYQSGGNLFENITGPVTFTGYFSGDGKLPEELVELKKAIVKAVDETGKKSGGRFSATFVDPDEKGGDFISQLEEKWGFRPMVAGLFSPETFWFYMVMKNGDQEVQVPLPEDLKAEAVQRVIDSALKRFSTGFLKTVAVWAPVSTPPMSPYAPREQKRQFRRLRQYLGEDFNVIDTDLKKGMVPENADILLLLAPESLNDKQLFGVDQFLMQGGSVIMATSFSDIEMNGALKVRKVDSGLEKWLEHNGITVEKELVFDPQNTPFPVPRKRNLGGFVVQETQLVNYPLFVDIRPDGMDRDSGLLAGIRQLTMSWASPVTVDGKKNGQRKINKLLFSSPDSWRSDNLNIQPDFDRYGELGFKAGETRGRAALAVMVEGGFTSWFKDKPSPLAAGKKEKKTAGKQGDKSKDKKEEPLVINRVIDHSPDSSRLFVFGSNTFLSDIALGLSSSVNGAIYDAPLQLVANCIDWSLEDRELLSMRSHTRFSRTLLPLQTGERRVIEYLNYGLALAGLVLIWIVGLWLRRRTRLRFQAILDDSGRV